MKNYHAFQDTVRAAASVVFERHGVPVVTYSWRRESPFQKARYKPEYVFPEVWVKRADGGRGAVITGEDIENIETATKRISEYLF